MSMRGHASRIPSLLFWEKLVLAFIIGILGRRFCLPAALLLLFFAGTEACNGGKAALLHRAMPLCIAAVLGLGWCLFCEPGRPIDPGWCDPGEYRLLRGRVETVRGIQDGRLRIQLADTACLMRDGAPATAVSDLQGTEASAERLEGLLNLTWEEYAAVPVPGQHMVFRAKIRPVYGTAGEYWSDRGVWHTAWLGGEKNFCGLAGEGTWWGRLKDVAESRLLGALAQMPGDHDARQAYAVIPALIFGNRSLLETESLDLFTRGSIVHSLSLSGQHFALCAMAAYLLAWLVGFCSPGSYLRMPRKKMAVLAFAPFGLAYLWLGGFPLSLVRAFCMAAVGGWLWLRARPAALIDLLFFAALLFVAAWPNAVFDLSCELSFLSVAAIAVFGPLAYAAAERIVPVRRRGGRVRRAARGAVTLLGISLVIQVCTLPVLINAFGRVSFLFPMNLLWLPVLEFVVLPLAALGTLAAQFAEGANVFLKLAAIPAEFMLDLLGAMDSCGILEAYRALRPLGASYAGYALILAAFAVFYAGRSASGTKRERRALRAGMLAAGGFILVLCSPVAREWEALAFRGAELSLIDVGQGQSALIRTRTGRILIDAGGVRSPRFDPGRDMVAPFLTDNAEPELAGIVITHDDTDHARGMLAIMQDFSISEIVRSSYVPKSVHQLRERSDALQQEKRIPGRIVGRGDSLELGNGFRLEVLHPEKENGRHRLSLNNSSLVLRLTSEGKGAALLCGDIEKAGIRALLKSGAELEADILVLPHHGGKSSFYPELYEAVSPKEAWVSCGRYNSYGFPDAAIVKWFEDRHIPVHTTAWEGDLSRKWPRPSR